MLNPFRRAAERAQLHAEQVAAHPDLADVDVDEIERAQEAERITAIARRTVRVREAQRHASALQRRAEALDAAVAGHDVAEREQTALVASTSKALEKSKTRLTAASKAADTALLALADAAAEHDLLVVQSAGELRAAGLPADHRDDSAVVEFGTGGAHRGEGVVIAGRWWLRLDVRTVVYRAVYGTFRARFGATDRAAGELFHGRGVAQLERRSAGLFDAAPLPAAFVRKPSAGQRILAEASAAREAERLAANPINQDAADDRRRDEEADDRKATAALNRRRQEIVRDKGQAHLDMLDAMNAGTWVEPVADEVPA